MKKYIFLLLIFLFFTVQAQTERSKHNYIKTRAYTSENESSYPESIQYYNGIGQPNEQVELKFTSASAFRENLYYEDPPSGGVACYNGNISALSWNMYYDNSTKRYAFTYDGLNRMKKATYSPDELFTEEVEYDKMGNITFLRRYASSYAPKVMIDNLMMAYRGNQLLNIDESVTNSIYGLVKNYSYTSEEYDYNRNGSMKYDVNNGISYIEYDVLNMPKQVIFRKGHVNLYTYDSKGRKLQVKHITVRNELSVSFGRPNNYTYDPNNVMREMSTDYCDGGSIIYEAVRFSCIR